MTQDVKNALHGYFVYPEESARLAAHQSVGCSKAGCSICYYEDILSTGEADPRGADLVNWFKSNGGKFHENLQLSYIPLNGRFVHRRDTGLELPTGLTLVQCPTALTISYLNVVDCWPFSCHGTIFPFKFLREANDYTAVIFFLMEQYRLGDDSFWSPYVTTLPQPTEAENMGTLPYYTEEDAEWLRGTNLYGALNTQKDQWKDKYAHGLQLMQNSDWPHVAAYTWELFKWAATILSTRSFSSKVLSGAVDRALNSTPDGRVQKAASEGFNVLLPLLDMLNHDPTAKAEWQANSDFVGLAYQTEVAELPFVDKQTGTEYLTINNNYGPKSNEELLMSYGFCASTNPYNFYKVGFSIPPGSPLDQIKQAQAETFGQEAVNASKDQYFICRPDYPLLAADPDREVELCIFSHYLWEATSILCANDRELAQIEMSEDACSIPAREYANSRNTLHTLGQFLAELGHRIRMLKQTGPSMGARPQNRRQANALLYRHSLIDIFETAVVVLEWEMLRARGDLSGSNSDLSLLYDTYRSNLPFTPNPQILNQDLLARPSLLPRKPELFDTASISTLLSPSFSTSTYIKSFLEAITPLLPNSSLFAASQKAIYTLFLSFAAHHRQSCNKQLKTWLKRIPESYGTAADFAALNPAEIDFDPEAFALLKEMCIVGIPKVTADFMGGGEEVDKNWMSLPSLTWAYTIVAEEGVFLTGDAWDAMWVACGRDGEKEGVEKVGLMKAVGVEESDSRGYLLYVPVRV